MRRIACWAAMFVIVGLAAGASMIGWRRAASSAAQAQAIRKDGRMATSASYRTLNGRVDQIRPRDQVITLTVSGSGRQSGTRGQTWALRVGNQTLLLRAGRNHQYTDAEFADLRKGDVVQAVVELQADPSDRSHNTWWLVVYPAGTRPPAR